MRNHDAPASGAIHTNFDLESYGAALSSVTGLEECPQHLAFIYAFERGKSFVFLSNPYSNKSVSAVMGDQMLRDSGFIKATKVFVFNLN